VLGAGAVARLICSAAAGADLLALDVADRLGIAKHVILPYAQKDFRDSSVTDRPGGWGPLFDRIIQGLTPADQLEVLHESKDSATAFRVVNQTIVERALQVAEQTDNDATAPPTAVIVWEGNARGSDDATADFRGRATKAGFRLIEVSTFPSSR